MVSRRPYNFVFLRPVASRSARGFDQGRCGRPRVAAVVGFAGSVKAADAGVGVGVGVGEGGAASTSGSARASFSSSTTGGRPPVIDSGGPGGRRVRWTCLPSMIRARSTSATAVSRSSALPPLTGRCLARLDRHGVDANRSPETRQPTFRTGMLFGTNSRDSLTRVNVSPMPCPGKSRIRANTRPQRLYRQQRNRRPEAAPSPGLRQRSPVNPLPDLSPSAT